MTQALLIVIIIAVILGGLAFLAFRRVLALRRELRSKDKQIKALSRNLAAIKTASEDDAAAKKALQALDKEIINAKTATDAAFIRRRFVAGAFNGL